MTEEKQQKIQNKLNNMVRSQHLAPDEAIGMFLSACLGIMMQVYKKPDGSPLSMDDAKNMMIEGLANSIQRNGTPPLTIVDTPEAAASHLEQAAKDAANVEGAKPISVDEAQNILEQHFKPPGSEIA